jgi:hypothetical protein
MRDIRYIPDQARVATVMMMVVLIEERKKDIEGQGAG